MSAKYRLTYITPSFSLNQKN